MKVKMTDFRNKFSNQPDFNFSPEGKRLLEIVLEKDDASEEGKVSYWLEFFSLFIGRAFWLVETFKARAQLESALRDRKIAISLKRLIDGDPKQERVKKTALIGWPIRAEFS